MNPQGHNVIVTWNPEKNARNRAKHGLDFESACLVFDDPLHLSRLERIEGGEERWQTVGMAGGLVLLLVAHTFHDEGGEEHIRIISARKATSHERRAYEEAH